MSLKDRLGFDAGTMRLEEAIQWAAENGIHYMDFNCDRGPNHLYQWDAERVRRIRASCERHDIHIGIHTLSAVNMAEFSPYVSEATDAYLRANIELAAQVGCEWLVVHGGYHFSSAIETRRNASIERLKRATQLADGLGQRLLLENHNFEPHDAEIHYQPYNVEECRRYFDAISSESFGWAFTVNHANLVPEGIDGFLDAFGVSRIGEVRVADNLGDKEVHLKPGEGNIDFARMFERIEGGGYAGHYSLNFGAPQDILEIRDAWAKTFGGE